MPTRTNADTLTSGPEDDLLDIYVINVDSKILTQVTSTETMERQSAWSPDGQRLAFESELDGDVEVLVADVDGRLPVRLTESE